MVLPVAVASAATSRRAVAIAAAWLAAPSVAVAACGGSLGYASDNIYRGASLTADRPAGSVDGHCEFARDWVAGVAASSVHLPWRSRNAQFGVYVDRRWAIGEEWSARVGVIHYDAPSEARTQGLRYDEVGATIGYRGLLRVTAAVSPNATDQYFGGSGHSHATGWLEATLRQPLAGRLVAEAGAGIAAPQGDGQRSYRYGNVGLSFGFGDVFVTASRIWTDSITWTYSLEGESFVAVAPSNARWVGSIVWTF